MTVRCTHGEHCDVLLTLGIKVRAHWSAPDAAGGDKVFCPLFFFFFFFRARQLMPRMHLSLRLIV
jgi:hypothetical protein